MESTLDCIVCLVRQALDAVRMVSTDPSVHESIMREVLRWTAQMDMRKPPPVLGQRIHRRLREIAINEDPYRQVKEQSNRMALALLSDLRSWVQGSPEPLDSALRLALAGNMIDLGVSSTISTADIERAVSDAMSAPLVGPLAQFQRAVAAASDILYLADNAGEIVFDRLFIEQLGPERVIVAVRGAPVINDATLEDAKAVGLDTVVRVIENGSDAPGTLVSECSDTFRKRFESADLIIAKGQGNFETLNTEKKNIFFLLKAKCDVIAAHVGLPVGTHVLVTPGSQVSGKRFQKGGN